MCAQAAVEEDRALLSAPSSPWRVTSVKALEVFKLWVEFQDGTAGSVEMRDFVYTPDAGMFAGLADPTRFVEVYVDFGVVTWPAEIDLAPEAMHREIRASGRWVLA